jgi:plasmid maintenance system antidote protein VapI
MVNELRGAVLAKYRSITEFAKALKWDRKKASRIVNRVQQPSVDDIYRMADLLDVNDPVSFVRIFLPSLTTKWGI